jgi:hypothetical protein
MIPPDESLTSPTNNPKTSMGQHGNGRNEMKGTMNQSSNISRNTMNPALNPMSMGLPIPQIGAPGMFPVGGFHPGAPFPPPHDRMNSFPYPPPSNPYHDNLMMNNHNFNPMNHNHMSGRKEVIYMIPELISRSDMLITFLE